MKLNTVQNQKQKGKVMCEFQGQYLPLVFLEESETSYKFDQMGWLPKEWFIIQQAKYPGLVLEILSFKHLALQLLTLPQQQTLKELLKEAYSTNIKP